MAGDALAIVDGAVLVEFVDGEFVGGGDGAGGVDDDGLVVTGEAGGDWVAHELLDVIAGVGRVAICTGTLVGKCPVRVRCAFDDLFHLFVAGDAEFFERLGQDADVVGRVGCVALEAVVLRGLVRVGERCERGCDVGVAGEAEFAGRHRQKVLVGRGVCLVALRAVFGGGLVGVLAFEYVFVARRAQARGRVCLEHLADARAVRVVAACAVALGEWSVSEFALRRGFVDVAEGAEVLALAFEIEGVVGGVGVFVAGVAGGDGGGAVQELEVQLVSVAA